MSCPFSLVNRSSEPPVHSRATFDATFSGTNSNASAPGLEIAEELSLAAERKRPWAPRRGRDADVADLASSELSALPPCCEEDMMP